MLDAWSDHPHYCIPYESGLRDCFIFILPLHGDKGTSARDNATTCFNETLLSNNGCLVDLCPQRSPWCQYKLSRGLEETCE